VIGLCGGSKVENNSMYEVSGSCESKEFVIGLRPKYVTRKEREPKDYRLTKMLFSFTSVNKDICLCLKYVIKMWSGGITPHILVVLYDVSNKRHVPVTSQSGKHSSAQKRTIFAPD